MSSNRINRLMGAFVLGLSAATAAVSVSCSGPEAPATRAEPGEQVLVKTPSGEQRYVARDLLCPGTAELIEPGAIVEGAPDGLSFLVAAEAGTKSVRCDCTSGNATACNPVVEQSGNTQKITCVISDGCNACTKVITGADAGASASDLEEQVSALKSILVSPSSKGSCARQAALVQSEHTQQAIARAALAVNGGALPPLAAGIAPEGFGYVEVEIDGARGALLVPLSVALAADAVAAPAKPKNCSCPPPPSDAGADAAAGEVPVDKGAAEVPVDKGAAEPEAIITDTLVTEAPPPACKLDSTSVPFGSTYYYCNNNSCARSCQMNF